MTVLPPSQWMPSVPSISFTDDFNLSRSQTSSKQTNLRVVEAKPNISIV